MKAVLTILLLAVGGLGTILGISFLYALVLKLVWEWLIPILLPNGPLIFTITYWEALGVSLICGMLFKGSSSK